jgi:hypothetical protein
MKKKMDQAAEDIKMNYEKENGPSRRRYSRRIMNITKIFSIKTNTIIINGVKSQGNDIRIIVDDVDISGSINIDKEINIKVEGVVDSVETSNAKVVVTGNVGGKVQTSNGKVEVGGNVTGGVNTTNASVRAGTISGGVMTSNGNINGKQI